LAVAVGGRLGLTADQRLAGRGEQMKHE
jgi:hypothetical protein